MSYNKAASYLKKKLREAAILEPETDLAELAVADDLGDEELYTTQLALVEEAVAHLPARKQAVFRLCRFEGKSAEEVAVATGISVASVKDYLKQSTRFIREYIHLGHAPTQALAVAGLLVLLELPSRASLPRFQESLRRLLNGDEGARYAKKAPPLRIDADPLLVFQ